MSLRLSSPGRGLLLQEQLPLRHEVPVLLWWRLHLIYRLPLNPEMLWRKL